MRIERFLIVIGLSSLAACAGWPAGQTAESRGPGFGPPGPTQGARAAASAGVADRHPVRSLYIRYRAEDVGLLAVIDDGRATYLTFEQPPPAALALFDQDGQPLARVTAGRVTAVDGLYAGMLVRIGEQASYIAPDPQAASLARPPFPAEGELAEARLLIERGAGLMQAMQRALQASRGSEIGRDAGREAALPTPTASAIPAAFSLPSAGAVVAPLAIANAAAVQADQGLVRVFFANASRTIVAPEDGLALLLRNAALAEEIRVTGFTDAVGSRVTNDALARARADAIVRILVRRGIDPRRIVSGGIAAADFIADNHSDHGRALNRRAEIVLLREGRPLALR